MRIVGYLAAAFVVLGALSLIAELAEQSQRRDFAATPQNVLDAQPWLGLWNPIGEASS